MNAAVTVEKAMSEHMIVTSLAISDWKKNSKMIGTRRNRQPTDVMRTRISRRIFVVLTVISFRLSTSRMCRWPSFFSFCQSKDLQSAIVTR